MSRVKRLPGLATRFNSISAETTMAGIHPWTVTSALRVQRRDEPDGPNQAHVPERGAARLHAGQAGGGAGLPAADRGLGARLPAPDAGGEARLPRGL
jgi:hypothetical protein